ncbi:hypothetical protein [Adonisia turfae]|nr:hypothetical protein [Adonisia turfae]
MADPAHPPSALVVNATGDRDIAASDRRDLLGLMRLDQSLSKLNWVL